MKSIEDVKKFFKNAAISTNARMDKTVLDKVLVAHEQTTNTKSAETRPNIRRTIMKSPIIKLTTAAVIIALVVLGLFEFIETENTSGVVWADVVTKVEASRGSVVRCGESFQSNEVDYTMKYFSPTHSRTDHYEAGQITESYYDDVDTNTMTYFNHIHKHYMSRTFNKNKNEFFLEQHDQWINPRYLVQRILSGEHRNLGQKTIEGVLCEGIETTDPAVMGPLPGPVERLEIEFQLWVSLETEYPVLFESKISGEAEGNQLESQAVLDQFQWDVELDESMFEPNIPADYIDISP